MCQFSTSRKLLPRFGLQCVRVGWDKAIGALTSWGNSNISHLHTPNKLAFISAPAVLLYASKLNTHHATNAIMACVMRFPLVTWPRFAKIPQLIALVGVFWRRAIELVLVEVARQAIGPRRIVAVQVQYQAGEWAIYNAPSRAEAIPSKTRDRIEDLTVCYRLYICHLVPVAGILFSVRSSVPCACVVGLGALTVVIPGSRTRFAAVFRGRSRGTDASIKMHPAVSTRQNTVHARALP